MTVINIDGVAFAPFVELFGPDRLPFPCAVISDADPPEADPEIEDPPSLSARAARLADRQNPTLLVRLAERTLEWDMAAAGNWRVLLDALAPIKPRVTARLRTELADVGDRDRADRILDAVTNAKGRFAQELAALLDDPDTAFTVPPYVTEAIEWVTS